jgi:hypothetical protein
LRIRRSAEASVESSEIGTTLVARAKSAPLEISTAIASVRLAEAANIRGVCSQTASRSLTSAPWSRSADTAAALPEAAAKWIGLVPGVVVALTSAPASISVSINSGKPLMLARISGE